MKKILGLDLGTNSIGWALTEMNFEKKEGHIKGLGSRIIPMSQDVLGNFDSGVSISQTAERTHYRGVRRLHQRSLLRRERLHRVLNLMDFLPSHYAAGIDFKNRLGQFKKGTEVKLNYKKTEDGSHYFIFMDSFKEMLPQFGPRPADMPLPLDWTLYYLRKKALNKKISKEELSWILLNFNQKRGYYQLRGEEEEEDNSKKEEFYALKVIEVREGDGKKKDGAQWYEVVLENGWIYKRASKTPLYDWVGKTREFIVTTTLDKDGKEKKTKEGEVKRNFRAVKSEEDWLAIKKKTEQDIEKSGKTVGEYIFDTLLDTPAQKVKGKLIKTIERKFYKQELKAILEKQKEFHPELQDEKYLRAAVEELYPKNDGHQQALLKKDFVHFFLEDIIFYQRPLKSKKSSIADCAYETRTFMKEGKLEQKPLKAAPKSHPLFQEFRLWQFIRNLRIYKKDDALLSKGESEGCITPELLATEEDVAVLFDFLNNRKEIDQKTLLEKHFKLSNKEYRWNYVEDRNYPCNETRALFLQHLGKVEDLDAQNFLSDDILYALWHLIYSVKDKEEFQKALSTFAKKTGVKEDSFVTAFRKIPPFTSDYGAYSEKALKKLLPFMRVGKYWKEKNITAEVKNRIAGIVERLETIDYELERLDKVADDDMPRRLLKSFIENRDNPYSRLNTYQACYAVYNRHSEIGVVNHWRSPKDIDSYLASFKQHSLRNPIVEQVVTETLRTVRDIWSHYGQGSESFFDEIHVELGREMKNPAKKRQRITEQQRERENTNERIKAILMELKNDSAKGTEIRPFSPGQQEILKLYEEGVFLNSPQRYKEIDLADIEKIRKNHSPSRKEIIKYKLWLEQGYLSPYTGKPIPLSKLFSTDYQIEHIIPQSRYFDNSMENKIICESIVNELKDNRTAYRFLAEEKGRLVELTGKKSVALLGLEEYEAHCTRYFKGNRRKLKNLLSDDIPEGFIERQLNDSRYISKLIKGLLSNVVREENEPEATAKRLLPVTGAITSRLKKDWGLHDKWNELVAPRFERMNIISGTEEYGFWDKDINAFRCQVPAEIAKGFNKKRIDHRHHALDALVIACVTKDHINYLNSLNSERKNHSLVKKLRATEQVELRDKKTGNLHKKTVAKAFHKPWPNFAQESKDHLEKVIVSFKQNTRILTKTNNKTWQWVKKDGKYKKELVLQTKGDSRSIRKSLHQETVYGKVQIKREKGFVSLNHALENWEMITDKTIRNQVKKKVKFYKGDFKLLKKHLKEFPLMQDGEKVTKVLVYEIVTGTASRVALTEKFTAKQLASVTDSGIRKILEKHLENYRDEKGKQRFDLAFDSNGVDTLNANIRQLNDGRDHQPIKKVRIYEVGNKFAVGETGNKKDKYVETAKGTNLYFAIYWNAENQKREYQTIPLNLAIERKKQGLGVAPEVDEKGNRLLFTLSPNDLVYMPNEEEKAAFAGVDSKNFVPDASRIYKMEKASGNRCYFITQVISDLIRPYDANAKIGEFGSQNKSEMDIEGQKITTSCWKLNVDRLGNIIKVTTGAEASNLSTV